MAELLSLDDNRLAGLGAGRILRELPYMGSWGPGADVLEEGDAAHLGGPENGRLVRALRYQLGHVAFANTSNHLRWEMLG